MTLETFARDGAPFLFQSEAALCLHVRTAALSSGCCGVWCCLCSSPSAVTVSSCHRYHSDSSTAVACAKPGLLCGVVPECTAGPFDPPLLSPRRCAGPSTPPSPHPDTTTPPCTPTPTTSSFAMADTAKSPKTSAQSSPRPSATNSAQSSPRSSASSSPKNATPTSSAPPTPTTPTANGDDGALARAEAQKAAGTARYSAGAFDEAIPLYTSALSLLPPSAPPSTRAAILSNRSACRLMLKQFPAALADSIAAIESDPTFHKAYNRAAKCHLAMGDFGQARRLLSQSPVKPTAADLAEVDKYERMQQKATELQSSNPHLALQFLSSLLQHCPANKRAHALQVQALINAKQLDKAKATVDALYREDPKNVEYLYLRGLCFYSLGNLDMAMKHMQQVSTHRTHCRG